MKKAQFGEERTISKLKVTDKGGAEKIVAIVNRSALSLFLNLFILHPGHSLLPLSFLGPPPLPPPTNAQMK